MTATIDQPHRRPRRLHRRDPLRPVNARGEEVFLTAEGYTLTARQLVHCLAAHLARFGDTLAVQIVDPLTAIDAHMRFDGDLTGWTTRPHPHRRRHHPRPRRSRRPRLLRHRLPRHPLVAAHDHHRSPPSGHAEDRGSVAAPAEAAAPRRLTRPPEVARPHRRHPRLPPPRPTHRPAAHRRTRHRADRRIPAHRRPARRRDLRALRGPPRLGLPTLRRDLSGRHLPTDQSRPRRRQRRPHHRRRTSGRVRHPHRTLVRARAHPHRQLENREGAALPDPPQHQPLPPRTRPGLHRPPHRERTLARAGRSAWTATTTPTTSSGTAGPANSGAAP